MLVSHKRIVLGSPPIEWAHKGLRDLSASLVDITGDIAIESSFLPGDFHGDPADRILVATARSKGLILLTKDKAILRYSSAHFVQTIAA
jgi:PIN domain nuclease of toxin-antitoxin system